MGKKTKKHEDKKIALKTGMDTNRKIVYILMGAVGLIVLIYLITYILMNSYNSDMETVETDIAIEKVERSLSGLSESENKEAILANATTLLNLTNIFDGGDDLNEVYDFVDNLKPADFDMNKIKELVDFTGYNDTQILNLLQSLVTFSYMLSDNDINTDIVPISSSDKVVLNNDLGFGFVPISIYTAQENPFNFMFAWSDDNWKLIPYPLIEQVRMSAVEED